jgi:hypothetical protein
MTITKEKAAEILTALNRCATEIAIHEQGPLACIAEMRRVFTSFGLTQQLAAMQTAVLDELCEHDKRLAPLGNSVFSRPATPSGIDPANLLISLAMDCRACMLDVMHDCEDMLRDPADVD